MKPIILISLNIFLNFLTPAFAEDISHKEGIKTGAETVINGTALMGIVGAISGEQSNTNNMQHQKTWTDLGSLQRAKPSIAEFGK
jgi:hypothetical protein